MRPIVFTTLVNKDVAAIVHQADAFCLSYFDSFLSPLEAELGLKSSHTAGRSHGKADSLDYKKRIEAINYTLAHDDGITDRDLAEAMSFWSPFPAAARHPHPFIWPCSSA